MRSGVGGLVESRRGTRVSSGWSGAAWGVRSATRVPGGAASGGEAGTSRAGFDAARCAASMSRQQSGRSEPRSERSQDWQQVECQAHARAGRLAPNESVSMSAVARTRDTVPVAVRARGATQQENVRVSGASPWGRGAGVTERLRGVRSQLATAEVGHYLKPGCGRRGRAMFESAPDPGSLTMAPRISSVQP